MNRPGPQRTAPLASVINVARVAFACVVVGPCAVGLAAQAFGVPVRSDDPGDDTATSAVVPCAPGSAG